jgi:hypothetical protein
MLLEAVITHVNIHASIVSVPHLVLHADLVHNTETNHPLVLVTPNTQKKTTRVFVANHLVITVILGVNTVVPLVLTTIILMVNHVQNVSSVALNVLLIMIVNHVSLDIITKLNSVSHVLTHVKNVSAQITV